MGLVKKCAICGKIKHLPDGKICMQCQHEINDLAKKSLRKAGYFPDSSDENHWTKN